MAKVVEDIPLVCKLFTRIHRSISADTLRIERRGIEAQYKIKGAQKQNRSTDAAEKRHIHFQYISQFFFTGFPFFSIASVGALIVFLFRFAVLLVSKPRPPVFTFCPGLQVGWVGMR